MGSELSPIEAAKLENLEIVITNGRKAFLEVGRALDTIKKERLYRVCFLTFEEYLATRWNMGTSHAYRMIDAANTVDEMSPIGDKIGWQPEAESQVRAVSDLPEEQRTEALTKAVEKHGPTPTAAQIKAEAAEVDTDETSRPQASTRFDDGEVEMEVDDEKDREDEAFRGHINAIRKLIDKRKPAELIGWDQDINDLKRYITARRNSR